MGLIIYMCIDLIRIVDFVKVEVVEFIEKIYGDEFLVYGGCKVKNM